MKALGSRMLPTPLVPRTAMALRFLLPMTAPTPERPAARCRSLTTAANSTWFSPARPMPEMRVSGSCSVVLRCSSVSHTLLPQMSAASRSSATSSLMYRYTGLGDLPSKMTMSQPAIFSSAPQ